MNVRRTLCIVVAVERSLERVRPAPTGSAMFDRYAGHVPMKTECITQQSLNWTCQRTGSLCSCNRHGVTCSRAAEFCTRCRGATVADRPVLRCSSPSREMTIASTSRVATSWPTRRLICGGGIGGDNSRRGHFGQVMFHGQFAVEMEAKVADDSGRLDVGRADLD